MLEKIKIALRKTNKNILDEDIQDLIDACIDDLQRFGVIFEIEPDEYEDCPLLIQSIKLYVKGYYGNAPDEKYKLAYDSLKIGLCLSGGFTKD